MAGLSEVHVKVVPELTPEFQALLGTATQDTLAKLDAGAALAYAIYHTPKDQVKAFFDVMPQGVIKAYMKACDAYHLGNSERSRVDVAELTDPVKYLPEEG